MFKLMHKKLNKKGFTLAELLVVVAIVAILVAIAVPVFTSNLEKAQIATNEANVRSTKAAAVSLILENWNTKGYLDDSSIGVTSSNGAKDGASNSTLSSGFHGGATLGGSAPGSFGGTYGGHGWVAYGHVTANGNLDQVKVTLASNNDAARFKEGTDPTIYGIIYGHTAGSKDSIKINDVAALHLPSGMVTQTGTTKLSKNSGDLSPEYVVIVYIPETDINGKT